MHSIVADSRPAAGSAAAPIIPVPESSSKKTTFLEDVGGFAKRLSSFKLSSKKHLEKSSPEALVPRDTLAGEANKFFGCAAEYAQTELDGTLSELVVLEQMNRIAAAKYSELSSTAEGLQSFAADLRSKHAELEPVFAEIANMDAAVVELEVVVNQLDDYSRRLEAKARALGGRKR